MYQFRQFSSSPADVANDTVSLRNFLVGYRDAPARPGIQRVLELNTLDLPPSSTGRIYCRLLELEITENL